MSFSPPGISAHHYRKTGPLPCTSAFAMCKNTGTRQRASLLCAVPHRRTHNKSHLCHVPQNKYMTTIFVVCFQEEAHGEELTRGRLLAGRYLEQRQRMAHDKNLSFAMCCTQHTAQDNFCHVFFFLPLLCVIHKHTRNFAAQAFAKG